MRPQFSSLLLLLLIAVLALFVWRTSQSLPPIVASHFASNGLANGFMRRDTYIILMLAVTVGVPMLLAFVPTTVAPQKSKKLSIPNRDYWLSPERRAHTIAFIRAHGQWFAVVLALFLAYVHWLVVRANQHQPPTLSTLGMISGLVAFFAALAAWLGVLLVHFRKRA